MKLLKRKIAPGSEHTQDSPNKTQSQPFSYTIQMEGLTLDSYYYPES